MYAIIQSGGKQVKAEPGSNIVIEKLDGEAGDAVQLDQVLMVVDGAETVVGQPLVENAVVHGEIVKQGRHPKILVFKSRRRKDSKKKTGHRQYYTSVLVKEIATGGAAAAVAEPEAAPETDTNTEE